MKIALSVTGTRGDVSPMAALGEHLLAAGHEVLLCGPPDFRHIAERKNFSFRPLGRPTALFMQENGADFAGGGARSHRALNRYIEEIVPLQFAELPAAIEGADLILGLGVQIAPPSLAEAWGVPYRYLALCPALVESSQHVPLLFPVWSLPAWGNRLAWRIAQRAYNWSLLPRLNRFRSGIGLPPVRDVYTYVSGERPILVSDPALAPAPPDCTPRPAQTGYLLPTDDTPLPADLEAFLSAGEPPVYVGFGSMGDPDPLTTTRLIAEALLRIGRRGIISHGDCDLSHLALPPTIIAPGAVDHVKLFPRVAVLVHHGGAGTTMTAARSGTPQVVIPHLNEHFYWGRAARRAGVAVPPIPRVRLTAERLANAIAEALRSSEMAERAKSLAEKLSDTDPAARILEEIFGSGAVEAKTRIGGRR